MQKSRNDADSELLGRRKEPPLVFELLPGESCFACLSMIFRYYKLVLHDEELRTAFSEYTEAHAPFGMIKISKQFGFHARALALGYEELERFDICDTLD